MVFAGRAGKHARFLLFVLFLFLLEASFRRKKKHAHKPSAARAYFSAVGKNHDHRCVEVPTCTEILEIAWPVKTPSLGQI
jgi:hypothetical protein